MRWYETLWYIERFNETAQDTTRHYGCIGNVGDSERNWDNKRPHETLWDSMRHYDKIGDMMRHYETAWDTMRHHGCNGTLWDSTRLWDNRRHHETLWEILRQHETRDIIDAMGQYETAWDYETIGNIMRHYEKSRDTKRPVSYTHLTLPTICSV